MKTWVTGSQWCAFYHLPLPALCFTGIKGYSNNDQGKLEADTRSNKGQNNDLVPQILHTTIMCNYDLNRFGIRIITDFGRQVYFQDNPDS